MASHAGQLSLQLLRADDGGSQRMKTGREPRALPRLSISPREAAKMLGVSRDPHSRRRARALGRREGRALALLMTRVSAATTCVVQCAGEHDQSPSSVVALRSNSRRLASRTSRCSDGMAQYVERLSAFHGCGMPSCRQIARTRPGPISLCRGTADARASSALRHFVCFPPSATFRAP